MPSPAPRAALPSYASRMLLLGILLLIPGVVGAQTAPTDTHPRLIEVRLGPGITYDTVHDGGFDIVEVKQDRLRLLEWPGDAARLARLGAGVTLIDADPATTMADRAAAEIAERPAPAGRRVRSDARSAGIYRTEVLPPFGFGSMGGYWTLAEVKMKLDQLVADDAQSLVADQVDSIGVTLQNRVIWGLRIGKAAQGPDTRPLVFFNALTHAREPEGMQALFYFIDDLLAKYGTDPTATYLLDQRVMYIVPVVNPDGYFRNQTTNPAGGGLWRKNLRDNDASGTITSNDGVDINRNYGYQWGLANGSSGSFTAADYRGTAAWSEPETRAQRDLVASLQPKTGLSFHTYSDLLLNPWGYTVSAPPDSAAFQEWADDMSVGAGYTTGQGIRVLYAVSGEFNDWTYGDVGLKPRAFTWTPEVGNNNDNFWPPPSRIVPLAQENLRHCYYVTSIAGPYARVERADVLQGPLVAGSSRFLAVRARNKGISGNAGPGLVANLTSLSAGTSALPGTVHYPTLPPLTSGDATGGESFLVAVDDTVTPGRLLRFGIDFTAPGGYFSRDTVELVSGIPTVLITEDASSGFGQWSPGSWGITCGEATHPSCYISDSPGASYHDTANSVIALNPTLDLSPGVHAYAIYDARWQFESDWDCGLIEASLNGSTWTPVRATGTSLGVALSGGGTQPTGLPVYDGARYNWRGERADLSPFTGSAGNAVRLRFRVRADGATRLDGFSFDSLRIVVYDPAAQPSPVAVGDDPTPTRLDLSPPSPNPIRGGQARFEFSLPTAGAVRLELFDLLGRHVRTLATGVLPAGHYARLWDGSDEAGRAAPTGVYLARVRGDAGTVTRRFAVLH